MPRFAANLSLIFTEYEFFDRFAHAARFPFQAVEFQFPYDIDATLIAQAALAAGLPIALFNAPPGDTKGRAALLELEDFQEEFQPALQYAAVLHPEKMHIMAGIAEPDETSTARFIRNISWAAAELEKLGVLAVIEPINQHSMPGYFLRSVDQATTLLEAIKHPNVKILFDIFHIQQLHGDLSRRLTAVHEAGILGHIQVASVPRRNEPGSGEVNDAALFGLIDDLGYPGFIGAEYLPAHTTVAGLDWLDKAVSTS